MSCGSAAPDSPAMTLAGSPGAAWISRKFVTAMASTTATIFTNRCAASRAKRITPSPDPNPRETGVRTSGRRDDVMQFFIGDGRPRHLHQPDLRDFLAQDCLYLRERLRPDFGVRRLTRCRE